MFADGSRHLSPSWCWDLSAKTNPQITMLGAAVENKIKQIKQSVCVCVCVFVCVFA